MLHHCVNIYLTGGGTRYGDKHPKEKYRAACELVVPWRQKTDPPISRVGMRNEVRCSSDCCTKGSEEQDCSRLQRSDLHAKRKGDAEPLTAW